MYLFMYLSIYRGSTLALECDIYTERELSICLSIYLSIYLFLYICMYGDQPHDLHHYGRHYRYAAVAKPHQVYNIYTE